jgi:DNA repair exonuclease SbcCD ATPase subunit
MKDNEMGRKAAVTYEQVAAVANGLVALGMDDPGPKVIREELANRAGAGAQIGSFGTIQKHLGRWRVEGRPIDPPLQLPDVPPQLLSELRRALAAVAQVAKETSERRVGQLELELAELASSCESHDARLDASAEDLAALTTERDVMAGRLYEHSAEATRLDAALTASTGVCHELRLELVAAQARLHGVENQLAAAARDSDEVRTQLATMLGELKVSGEALVEADREVVLLKAQLLAAHAALSGAERREKELHQRALELEPWVVRCAGAESAVTELRKQADVLSSLVRRPIVDARPEQHDPA